MLKEAIGNIEGFRLAFLGMVALSVAEAMLSTLSVAAVIPAGGALLGSALQAPWPLSEVGLLTGGSPAYLLLALAGLLMLKVVAALANAVLTASIKRRLWRKWSMQLVSGQLHMPYRSWVKQDGGELINLTNRELTRASSVIPSIADLLTQLLSFVFLVLTMIMVSWEVVAAAAVLGLLIYFVGLRVMNRKARTYGTAGVALAQNAATRITETIASVRDIRLLGAEKRRIAEVDEAVDRMTANDFKVQILQAIPVNAVEFLVALIVLLLAAGALYFSKDISAAEHLPVIVFFLVGLFRLSSFAANLSALQVKLIGRYPSFLAVMHAIASRPTPADDGTAEGSPAANVERWRPRRAIELRHLSFSHDNKTVLKGVNLALPVGAVTYLFGGSGSGKSSLADVVARLHEPPSGTIMIDDVDSREIPLAVWRRLVGYVSQEPMLFQGSVFYNVAIGHPEATREEVKRALDLVGALRFVEAMDGGLDAMIAERGRNLSGGQKCRLAIARALLRKPALLVLDESLGGIERELESEIIQRLRAVEGLSVIIISHRWDNVALADQVAVLRDGALMEGDTEAAAK